MAHADLELSDRQLTNIQDVESEETTHGGSPETEDLVGTTSNQQLQRQALGGDLLAMNTTSNSKLQRAAAKAKPATHPQSHPQSHNKQQNPLDRPVTHREQLLQEVEAKRQAWQAAEERFGNVLGRLQDLVPALSGATIGKIFSGVAKDFGASALASPGDFMVALRAVVASLSLPEMLATLGVAANIGLWWQNWQCWQAARSAEDAYNHAVEAARAAGAL